MIDFNDVLMFVASVFLLLMFFISGVNKCFKFDDTVTSVKSRIPMLTNNTLASIVIVMVILLELVAPVVIWTFGFSKMMGNTTPLLKNASVVASILLIIFTIIATLVYHPLNFNASYMKNVAFFANTSVTGGLMLQTALMLS